MKLDTNQINDLVTLSLEDSQTKALEMLNQCTFKNGSKKVHLQRDIQKARKAEEVCRIMYFTYLAGEGLSVTGSEWQKNYA